MPLKLVIANKAYSSWSLRPWLLLAAFHIPFEEVVIPLYHDDSKKKISKYSPTGKLPALVDDGVLIWDSIAIVEYIAELYPKKAIWPLDRAARAHARSLSAEMHAGFQALRTHCNTNFRRSPKKLALSPVIAEAVEADVKRIEQAWAGARKKFGGAGPFLFGAFCAADAMFAPVVNRLYAYDLPVSAATKAYMKTMLDMPAYRAWLADGAAEPWVIEAYEI